jgi:hypothetical protein
VNESGEASTGEGLVFVSLNRTAAGSRIGILHFAHTAISGLFAALRTRHDADRSVGKVAAFLALPQ